MLFPVACERVLNSKAKDKSQKQRFNCLYE